MGSKDALSLERSGELLEKRIAHLAANDFNLFELRVILSPLTPETYIYKL